LLSNKNVSLFKAFSSTGAQSLETIFSLQTLFFTENRELYALGQAREVETHIKNLSFVHVK